MGDASYAIGIGSNRRGRHGGPLAEVAAAIRLLHPVAVSPIIETPPVGPSHRRYANAAVVIATDAPPDTLLARLKGIERAFGRRPGRRWGARVIDLDIVLWSEGAWRSAGVTVPHIAYRDRHFVLRPLAAIVPGWRDPRTGLAIRHLLARLTRRRPLAKAPMREPVAQSVEQRTFNL